MEKNTIALAREIESIRVELESKAKAGFSYAANYGGPEMVYTRGALYPGPYGMHQLAELWPKGFMDNHGIKRAICRAKERRRALYNSRHKDDQDKLKRKKIIAEIVKVVTGLAAPAQPQYACDKMVTDSASHGLTSSYNKPTHNSSTARVSSSSTGGPNTDRPKQEKLKGSASLVNPMDNSKILDGVAKKKKLKRKPEQELDEAHLRPEKKLPMQSGEERQKTLKHSINNKEACCGYSGAEQKQRPLFNSYIIMMEVLVEAYINANTPAYGIRDSMKAEKLVPNRALSEKLALVDVFNKTSISHVMD
ncbi:hypothetical protein ACFE04_015746 [Oxalis oulophora]